jgi:hypothetical protein
MSVKLNGRERAQIAEIFIRLFRERGRPERGELEQIWYEVITTFFNYQGDQIVPKKIREAEDSIVDRGLGKEYFAALTSVVNPPSELSEDEQAILLITASPEDREKAIKKVILYR